MSGIPISVLYLCCKKYFMHISCNKNCTLSVKLSAWTSVIQAHYHNQACGSAMLNMSADLGLGHI